MTAVEAISYMFAAFLSGYCLGYGVYAWRRFFENL